MDQKKQGVFDKLETFYLSAMRKALLIFSTVLFAYAAIVGLTSLYKISRSADSVVEAKPNIQATDIIPWQEMTSSNSGAVEAAADAAAQVSTASPSKTPFDEHTSKIFAIWSLKFEIHKKKDDPKLSEIEFGDWYYQTFNEFRKPNWCSSESCTSEELSVIASDFSLAESAISAAADDSTLKARMISFQRGKTNIESEGYDKIFVRLNQNFWKKLTEERNANQEAAAAERAKIAVGKIEGGLGIVTSGWALVTFLSLMFAFLLVAVERHQRKMAGDIEKIKANLIGE